MYEILHRIKSINLKRRTLVISLIVAEAIGIIALLWYLRTPLAQKFIFTPPKAYSLVTMDPKKRYLISQGDYIQGKGIPNTEIKALFTPGLTKITAAVDQKGSFNLQIPTDIDPKTYRLTIANYDRVNNLAFSKGYRIRIQSNNRLLQNPFIQKILNPLRVKKAQALDGTPGTDYDWNRVVGPEWMDWMKLWHQAGICPAIDDSGEILTYMNKEAYDELYGPLYTCPAIESLKGWLDEIAYDKGFFVDLWFELMGRGYSEEAFIDYFPNWKTFIAENRPSNAIIVRPIGIDRKDSIDENTFIQIMYDVAVERKYQERSSLLKIFLNSTDPILGLRGPYNVVTGYKFTNGWDYVDGLLFILSFAKAPQAGVKAGVAVTEKNIAAMTLRREAIVKEGAVLTQTEMLGSGAIERSGSARAKWVGQESLEPIVDMISKRAIIDVVHMPYGYMSRMIGVLSDTVARGGGGAMRQDLAQNYIDTFISSVRTYFAASGIDIPIAEKELQGFVQDYRIIFLTPKSMRDLNFVPGIAYANEAYVVIKSDIDVNRVIYHELSHVNAWNLMARRNLANAGTFSYNREQADIYGKVMSEFLEIGADLVNVRIFNATEGPYFSIHPQRHQAIQRLIDTVNRFGGELNEHDFMELALTGDDRVFMAKILKHMEPEFFLLQVGEVLNLASLQSVKAGSERALAAAYVNVYDSSGRLIKTPYSALGIVPIPLSTYFEKSALGESIPENSLIVDSQNEEDIDLLNPNIQNSQNQLDVQITTVDGNNGVLTLAQPASFDSVLSKNGYSEDPNEYAFNWVAETEGSPNKTDTGDLTNILCQTTGSTSCSSNLPSAEPGQYIIKLYVTKSGSNSIVGTGIYSVPITIQANPPQQATSDDSQAPMAANNCEASNWKDEKPYSCQDGWACYYRWKIAGGTSCDPERDYGDDGQHFVCFEDSDCRTLEPGGDS